MMDNSDDSEDAANAQEKDTLGLPSPSSSFGSSLGASQDFRRMMKPPNKKKYKEEMGTIMENIKLKEAELKSLGARPNDGVCTDQENIRAEKDANMSKRKKVDIDLKQLNLTIQKLRGSLSTTESNLHYKNEAKIDEAIRKLDYQLKVQNFKLSEERKIVAEIDKLKRSKKVLVQYFAQKRELDEVRAKQNRLRGEREYLYKNMTTLKNREDEIRKSRQYNKTRSEELKKEIDELYDTKRKLFADFKQHETDYYRAQKEHQKAQKKESFKKREEERRAKELAYRKEMQEFESQKEPFEDEKNLCNTLMSYLQKYSATSGQGSDLASPREEQPDTPLVPAAPGIADSLDDGMFVRLKKSDEGEPDYSISSKRPSSRRGRKGKKTSVTKPLAHTPQIIAQFASLNLNAPSNMSEVAASLEQLQARKRFYDEHAATVQRPLLGSLSGSFSSSGSMSSMESPLRERSSTWGFVEVPPAILECHTQSDCGKSAESGFHDMSRQASKTESSESATDCQPCDNALEEMIRQSAEYGDSEHSRSSSDTVTPEDHITEDLDQPKGSVVACSHTSSGDGQPKTRNQSELHDTLERQPILHDSDSAVFSVASDPEDIPRGGSSCDISVKTESSYDLDFPATLNTKSVRKELSQTFPGEPKETPVPGNTGSDLTDKTPTGDLQDALASSPNDKADVLHVSKLDEASKSEINGNQATASHIENQQITDFHKSATASFSDTGNIWEPQDKKLDKSLDKKVVNKADKLLGVEINSDAHLLRDNNKICDTIDTVDCYLHSDGLLDEVDSSLKEAGVVHIEGAGIELNDRAGLDGIEGASGIDFIKGASGIDYYKDLIDQSAGIDGEIDEHNSFLDESSSTI